MSERTGRGGRNEDAKKNLPDTVVLGAVGYMLDNDTKAKEGSLNLTSLFKKRPAAAALTDPAPAHGGRQRPGVPQPGLGAERGPRHPRPPAHRAQAGHGQGRAPRPLPAERRGE